MSYEVIWLNNSAKVEFPFSVRAFKQDEEEFQEMAQRDFSIICRFAIKFSTRKGVPVELANDVINQMQLYVTRSVAFVRGLVANLPLDSIAPILYTLHEECLGNLPAVHRNGKLSIHDEPAKSKRRRERREREITDSIGHSINALGGHLINLETPPMLKNGKSNAQPLVIAVPNPKK